MLISDNKSIKYRFNDGDDLENSAKNCRNDGKYWTNCTAWIFTYDNADYLYIDNDGKCPNGTVLSDSNPTCN